MPNVFHKNYTLDNCHALHARQYADVTAMEADTVFNSDSSNLGKAILVDSPPSLFTLLTTAPLFLDVGAVGSSSGNVTTSDTLTAGQLLLGNGTTDIVTESDLTYDGSIFNVSGDIGIGSGDTFIIDGKVVFFDDGAGEIELRNIDSIDSTTTAAIQTQIFDLPALATITSGGVTGPSGAWSTDGFNTGPNDGFLINFVPVLDDTTSTITLRNIAALDATTEATIQSALGAVTTSDVLTAAQLLLGNGGTDIVTEADLFYTGTSFFIDNAGFMTPSASADDFVIRNSSTAGMSILSNGTQANFFFGNNTNAALGGITYDFSNDKLLFRVNGQIRLGLDQFGMFGIGTTAPDNQLHVLDTISDTSALVTFESTSTNGAAVQYFVGDRNPEGIVTGNPGDKYLRDNATLSGSFVFKGASAGTAGWSETSVLAPDILQLHASADLDDLASGGIITVAANTTWRIRGPLTTANRIVVNAGITLSVIGEYNSTASITYSGTDTFLTIAGSLNIRANMIVISTSTGTLISATSGSAVNLEESGFIGWDSLGSFASAEFVFMSESFFLNATAGFTLTDVEIINVMNVVQNGTAFSGEFFTIDTDDPDSAYVFNNMDARTLAAAGSVFDFNTRINNQVSVKILGSQLPTGDLFKQTVLTDATINSVTDGSPATGTLTEMADNGSGGTTVSCTTTYFEDEELTLSGTTNYNGDFQIFNVVAGVSFDIITAFVADDATGSADSVRIVASLAGGHGISPGDSIKIIDTVFYNAFYTVLDESLDDIVLNNVFVATDTGSIERELSLDQSDPRISALLNNGFDNSRSIGGVVVNGNGTDTTINTQNVFEDLDLNDSAVPISTMERWKLVDADNGEMEYIGLEPFNGTIQGHFSVLSPGSQNYGLRWIKQPAGSSYAVLPDAIEVPFSTNSSSGTFPVNVPLTASIGDRIKAEVRNLDGEDDITITDLSMGAMGL